MKRNPSNHPASPAPESTQANRAATVRERTSHRAATVRERTNRAATVRERSRDRTIAIFTATSRQNRHPAPWYALLVAIVFSLTSTRAAAQIAVRGEIVHTMAGDAISNGVVVVESGKISAVGPADRVRIPQGFPVLTAKVVTPGLIDAHATVGLTGIYNQEQDQDQLERSTAMQPDLRAVDAFNIHDPLVKWVRDFGVTTVHTGHAPGEFISGQTMVVKTWGNTVEAATLVPTAMVACTLASSARKGGDKSPGTRAKMMAMLRGKLIEAREYQRKRIEAEDRATQDSSAETDVPADPARDLKMDVLARVIAGELPLLVTAQRAQDIANALRLAREFEFRLVLDGAAESYLLIDEIKAAKVPVIVHPLMARYFGELKNASFETPAKLRAAGIPVCTQSGFEDYVPKTRVVLFETAIAAANGLTFEQALSAMTIDPARLLKVDDRVGSLEVGKDGDLALYDGDPFEYTSHCVGVVINGEVVNAEPR
jgi:imidazolonepropionase-like amidohydrolase